MRPHTLTASLSPVILSMALLEGVMEWWHWVHLGLVALCALSMQAGANLANDYYDVRRGVDASDRIGPLRALQLGEVSAAQLKAFFVLCFAFAWGIGLYLSWMRGIELFALGMLCIVVAYCYTGGPWPLSHHMLGEVVAFLFFGPVAILGTLWSIQGHFALVDFALSPSLWPYCCIDDGAQ